MGGGYGIGVRGSRSWATIHPGFLSGYANFDQKDLNVAADGKLSAAMNTDVSKEFHRKWVQMIQDSGAPDWSTHTWYQVGTDLGAGKSAMIFDADILGYFMNGASNAEAGNLAFSPFKANPAAAAHAEHLDLVAGHVVVLADKDAAWYFLQWASGPSMRSSARATMDFVNPVRASVWADGAFRDKLSKSYPGYVEMHDVSAPGRGDQVHAQPLFFDLTTEWAATLQKMVAKEVPVDEGLDQLAESVDGAAQGSRSGLIASVSAPVPGAGQPDSTAAPDLSRRQRRQAFKPRCGVKGTRCHDCCRDRPRRRRFRVSSRVLPYLLSLPAC
jgi:multiple sugar transport system substrate-binding protein